MNTEGWRADLDRALDLANDSANFAVVTTLFGDGSPQTTPVWVDAISGALVFNTDATRAKFRNLQRDPRVSLMIMNNKDPYQYVEIRGKAEMELEGAREHIDLLSEKYTGKPYQAEVHQRVVVKVLPMDSSSKGF